ncbi:TPA: hypothetical protein DEO28_04865 [Candidatus Dependentiae bacterium]|nr:MAG: Phosphoesterase RecJ domain protein [candidate division TM6 bacterium GW2011_GWE2_31_21]KKP53883.1 MAG: Phosphoesterase RecJ domain protein [candidate division TM6 bacterium GW2011_GWF2_33_332]HBS47663.1 hypothetical protein [Candidatus Dependentiae bacterium]HBZ73812.1 hypothetical protein [Candidatus Dependentiae bacterium]
METNLKTMNKKNLDAAWNLIKNSKKITLLTHFKPDGDAIGSCGALETFLENCISEIGEKQIETVYPTPPEIETQYASKNVFINSFKQMPDLLIALDTSTYSRLFFPKEFLNIPFINIDHHISSDIKPTINFLEPLSSACELLFDILDKFNSEKIDKVVATKLLFGILSDSKIFKTQSTTTNTLQVATTLMGKGADLYKLQAEILATKTPAMLQFWGELLNKLKSTSDSKIIWSTVKKEDFKKYNLTSTALVGFINLVSDISTSELAILIYENEDNMVQVSFRSKNMDVNKLASNFGGGGHKNAAGLITSKKLELVEKDILNFLNVDA